MIMAQRLIKFRGKHIVTGEWLYGSHFNDGGEQYILPNNILDIDEYEDKFEVNPDTVGEYTGLTDKYGNGIYEGDVVKRHCSAYGLDDTGIVKFDNETAMFVLYCEEKIFAKKLSFLKSETINDGYATIIETFTYEIIGNIHDNPEMVKILED